MIYSACTEADVTDGLAELSIDGASTEIDSRTTLEFTVLGTYEDGSEADVTADADIFSSDEDVVILDLLGTNLGHGIGEGVATVHATLGELDSNSLDIAVSIAAVQVGDLAINEVLADDGDFDANGDGSTQDEDDEFIELVNTSFTTVDLGGVMVRDSNYAQIGPRHTFASPTHLKPGQAIVLFGGGSVENLLVEGTTFVVAENDDKGLNHGLSLNNTGEYISLVNDDSAVLVNFAYGDQDDTGSIDSVDDASINRSPDIIGPDYQDHRLVEGSTAAYSPGTRVDGETFPDLDEWFSQLLPD